MAFILLAVGLGLVIYSKISYNQRCTAGQGIPYDKKELTMMRVGYVLLAIAFVLAVFNKA